MNIALMAHDNKKELMVQFCTAYAGILARHKLYATNTTGHMVADSTGLDVHCFLTIPPTRNGPATSPTSPGCAIRTASPSPATLPPPKCWYWASPGVTSIGV